MKKHLLEPTISFEPKDIEDPANAAYLYEGPDGTKFIDWNNPGHKLERWAERIKILATRSLEEAAEYYSGEYFRRLARKYPMGPDHSGEKEARGNMDETKLWPIRVKEEKSPFEINEVVVALRSMKDEIKELQIQKLQLARAAALSGCPESGDPECPMREFSLNLRDSASCTQCWLKHVESNCGGCKIARMFGDRRQLRQKAASDSAPRHKASNLCGTEYA